MEENRIILPTLYISNILKGALCWKSGFFFKYWRAPSIEKQIFIIFFEGRPLLEKQNIIFYKMLKGSLSMSRSVFYKMAAAMYRHLMCGRCFHRHSFMVLPASSFIGNLSSRKASHYGSIVSTSLPDVDSEIERMHVCFINFVIN